MLDIESSIPLVARIVTMGSRHNACDFSLECATHCRGEVSKIRFAVRQFVLGFLSETTAVPITGKGITYGAGFCVGPALA